MTENSKIIIEFETFKILNFELRVYENNRNSYKNMFEIEEYTYYVKLTIMYSQKVKTDKHI